MDNGIEIEGWYNDNKNDNELLKLETILLTL